ncbi:hypothetical protein SAMN05880574_12136 [Chryseobacterium sp. RU37D]|nr:hypothetical protein SAMN05880574_12136 [Chryseobacterium sp. RU37D]
MFRFFKKHININASAFTFCESAFLFITRKKAKGRIFLRLFKNKKTDQERNIDKNSNSIG